MPRPEGMGTARHAAPTAAAELGLGLLRGDNTSLPFLPAASPDSTVSHRHSTALKALTGGREHRSTGTQPREPAHSRPAPAGTAGLPREGNESVATGDTARHPCAPGGCSCPGRGDTVPHGLCSWPWGGLVPHAQGRFRMPLVSPEHCQHRSGPSLSTQVPRKTITKVVPAKLGHLKCGFTQGFCTNQMSRYSTI